MFNQKFINVLLKILGWVILISTAIMFVAGFFIASSKTYLVSEAIGFWVGYTISGLVMCMFFYALIGVLYRVNNRS